MVNAKRVHNETEAKTRVKKKPALAIPCLVILKGVLNILKLNTGSPGLKILKMAGKAIKRENSGIKIQVRFKKKPIFIDDTAATKRQKAYMLMRKKIFLENKTAKRSNKIIKTLTRASRACRKPCFAAYASENTDSLIKEHTPNMERWIKLPLLTCFYLSLGYLVP